MKYDLTDDEEWSKFSVMKSASLPSPAEMKYNGVVPVKATKAADVKKIVEKYVPQDFKSYYDSLL